MSASLLRFPGCAGLLLQIIALNGGGASAQEVLRLKPKLAITIGVVGENPPPLRQVSGRIILAPSNEVLERIDVLVTAGRVPVVHLAGAGTWTLKAEIPGFWASRQVLTPTEAEVPARVKLWPSGRVAGAVKVKTRGGHETAKLPESLAIRFASPPGTAPAYRLSQARTSCPVKQGEWQCELPATVLDLRLRARGFGSEYRPATPVPRGETLRLGTLTLVAGASLVGRVEAGEGGTVPGGGEARLIRATASPGNSFETQRRIRDDVRLARVQTNGFFQFEGIAPGRYALEVIHPRYAETRIYPLDVYDDAETVLKDPVVLRPPITVEAVLRPATDWADKPWTLTVLHLDAVSGFTHEIYSGPPDRQGRVTLRRRNPGTYHFSVSDSQGARFIHQESVVDEGNQLVVLDVPVIGVTGTVTLGNDPLRAQLWFGGRSGAVSIDMAANEDGEFQGFLPRESVWKEGGWWIDVAAQDPPVSERLEGVKVRPNEDGEATLRLSLPDTEVYGRVVDEGGQAAEGARVTTSSGSSLRAGAGGEFRFRGLREGPTALSAELRTRDKHLTAEPMIFQLHEGISMGPIEIRLLASRSFAGRILSPTGAPVVGAQVLGQSYTPRLGYTTGAQTSLNGEFSLSLPKNTRVAQLTVSPPGYALSSFLLDVEQGARDLIVEAGGGSLEISVSGKRNPSRTLVVLHNGARLPLAMLHQWAAGNGETYKAGSNVVIYPRLAPGEYTACLATRDELRRRGMENHGAWEQGLASCEKGYLPLGGAIRLRLERPD